MTHYQLLGHGSAQTVVLIHGFSVPFQVWDPIFEPLVDSGFQVLRYDLFGRGFSDRPQTTYDQSFFDRQLAELVSSLRINQPIDLVGLSMGAAISVLFCLHHPELVQKLVLIDPAGFPTEIFRWIWIFKLPLMGELLMSLIGERFLQTATAKGALNTDKYPSVDNIIRHQMKIIGYRRALLSTLRNNVLGDLSDVYQEVGKQDREVCLIWGTEDRLMPLEMNMHVRQAMPYLTFYPISDAGHVPHYDQPEIVLPLLIDFLRGNPES
jgi:pimeloyl-ACP methyl ester carboxylesterase